MFYREAAVQVKSISVSGMFGFSFDSMGLGFHSHIVRYPKHSFFMAHVGPVNFGAGAFKVPSVQDVDDLFTQMQKQFETQQK